ncbi:ABC transporter ATP-binding protein [Enterobacter roggenkampii]|uniref:ABC transporter ATP-binding protein n=1 Tax=Enterobacter roggenkampii TaxID=1812935 RepID=UPI0032AF5406
MSSLLALENLQTTFRTREGEVHAVRGVSFQVQPGELVGIVGESGCGKSVTCKSIIQLLGSNGRITGGSIRFQNDDLAHKTPAQMRAIRGNEIAMIFQDPMTALNPVLTIGKQMAEILMRNKGLTKKAAKAAAIAMLEQVGIAEAERRYDQYPHEFSGGQRQRISIARALSVRPEFVLCDEPLSALDVSVQAQVVNILQDLQQELGLTYLFIAHDLSMVRHISSRIGVMYLGKLVEVAPANELYQRPAHPYTRALLAAVPQPDPRIRNLEDATLRGEMPGPTSALPGCKFCSRCPHAVPVCQTQEPAMQEIAPGHFAACWLFKM